MGSCWVHLKEDHLHETLSTSFSKQTYTKIRYLTAIRYKILTSQLNPELIFLVAHEVQSICLTQFIFSKF